jgi:hypothetical protein
MEIADSETAQTCAIQVPSSDMNSNNAVSLL